MAKRLLILSALVALSLATGCRSWCERHYPCQQPVAYAPAPQGCVPCCPAGSAGYGNVPPPPPPPQDWGTSRQLQCTCSPVPTR